MQFNTGLTIIYVFIGSYSGTVYYLPLTYRYILQPNRQYYFRYFLGENCLFTTLLRKRLKIKLLQLW